MYVRAEHWMNLLLCSLKLVLDIRSDIYVRGVARWGWYFGRGAMLIALGNCVGGTGWPISSSTCKYCGMYVCMYKESRGA
jgi:hypothetical protein